jgi:hypothetical protein
MPGLEHVRFVRHPIAFNRAFRSWAGPVGQALRSDTELVAVAARVTSPRDTGELAAGHETDYGHHGVHHDLESRVIAVPKQAIYVIKGTEPHVIQAKRASRLVFFWKKVGRIVSFKSVNHPGHPQANNYLLESLKRIMRRRT